MISYLIKNNFKIMFRNAVNILLLILAPLAVIAVLSSAFHALMEKYEGVESFKAGYRMEGEKNDTLILAMDTAAKEQGITFVNYGDADVKETMKRDRLGCFVVFEEGSYTVYEAEESKEEGQILEFFLHAFFENMSVYKGGGSVWPKTEEKIIKAEAAEHLPAIDSTDYYGIIYVIYFSWCTIVCGAGLFSAEKKYRMENRFRVSGISEIKLYLAKLLPLTMIVSAGIAVCTVMSVLLFGVHWGNVFWSALLVFAGILAAASMGLMFYAVSGNMVITVIAVFMLVWIWGFIGGSFETYIFSAHPESIKQLSPIYYENRAAVELSCMGKSDYTMKSLLISGTITILCSAVSVAAGIIRRRGRK